MRPLRDDENMNDFDDSELKYMYGKYYVLRRTAVGGSNISSSNGGSGAGGSGGKRKKKIKLRDE